MSIVCYIQMDPLDHLVHEDDTTLFLAKEAIDRGYKVYSYRPKDLSLKGTQLIAKGRRIKYSNSTWRQESFEDLHFNKANILLVRQEPPFDMDYITSTYLLDFVPKECLIINNPWSLRNFPEKILPHYFEQYLPPTLISYNYEEMCEFFRQHGISVLKPLYLYGGKSVVRISSQEEIHKYLTEYNSRGEPLMMQKFLSSVTTKGDKRLIFIDGELRGSFSRKPRKGSFLTNFYENPVVELCDLTLEEQAMAAEISLFLKKQNIYFAGVDILQGYLLEINTTCPASLPTLKKLAGIELDKVFWDKLELRVD